MLNLSEQRIRKKNAAKLCFKQVTSLVFGKNKIVRQFFPFPQSRTLQNQRANRNAFYKKVHYNKTQPRMAKRINPLKAETVAYKHPLAKTRYNSSYFQVPCQNLFQVHIQSCKLRSSIYLMVLVTLTNKNRYYYKNLPPMQHRNRLGLLQSKQQSISYLL